MFCRYCGSKANPGYRFCENCGKEIATKQTGYEAVYPYNINNTYPAGKRKKWFVPIVIIVAICITVIAVIGGYKIYNKKNKNSSYEVVLDKYFKAIETADGQLWRSIIADDYIDYMVEGWGYSERELIEEYQDSLDDAMEDHIDRVGPNIKITYKITETYKPDKSEIEDLNYCLEDYGFEYGDITDAIVVDCEYKISGDNGSGFKTCELLLIKVHGEWYRSVGYLDLSWY